jgi:hypothetical protein
MSVVISLIVLPDLYTFGRFLFLLFKEALWLKNVFYFHLFYDWKR